MSYGKASSREPNRVAKYEMPDLATLKTPAERKTATDTYRNSMRSEGRKSYNASSSGEETGGDANEMPDLATLKTAAERKKAVDKWKQGLRGGSQRQRASSAK